MIQVFLDGDVVAEYTTEFYYAEPSGGALFIRLFEGDVVTKVFEIGEWDDVRW